MSSLVAGGGMVSVDVAISIVMLTVVPWPSRFGVKLTWSLADCAACALADRHAQASSEARRSRARRTVVWRYPRGCL